MRTRTTERHGLGRTAQRILDAIMRSPVPPSVRELMVLCGLRSPNGVKGHLDRLKKLGLITSEPRKARTYRAVLQFDGLPECTACPTPTKKRK